MLGNTVTPGLVRSHLGRPCPPFSHLGSYDSLSNARPFRPLARVLRGPSKVVKAKSCGKIDIQEKGIFDVAATREVARRGSALGKRRNSVGAGHSGAGPGLALPRLIQEDLLCVATTKNQIDVMERAEHSRGDPGLVRDQHEHRHACSDRFLPFTRSPASSSLSMTFFTRREAPETFFFDVNQQPHHAPTDAAIRSTKGEKRIMASA